MELFKQFTEMLENFINGVVDKRLAETPKQPPVNPEALKAIVDDYLRRTGYIPELVKQAMRDNNIVFGSSLEQQLLVLLNQEGEPDRITPIERAVRQIAKDSIPCDLVTESFMEDYCEDFLESDQAEQAVFDALRGNSHEVTDIIHDNLDTNRIRGMLADNDIVGDIMFDSIMQDDRFYLAVVDNMVHAIQNSDYLEFNRRVRDVVTDDGTLKDELKTIVKDHFADNGVFEDRVCQIIRNKL